jgi:formate hydrogenlyase subunit 3/multisubunit Na+/H+ antiporter MnhD subunit
VSQLLQSPLALCVLLLTAWSIIGVAGLIRPMSIGFVGRTLFPLGALCSAALALIALASLADPAQQLVLPIGLPDLPVHLRLDALARTFLVLLGGASTGISIFAAGYFRRGEGTAPGLLCVQYHLFLASMGFVLLADDAYAFMLAWEMMALSSYFLVTTQHRIPEMRKAGYLYLLIAHLGAIAILLSFGKGAAGGSRSTPCVPPISIRSGLPSRLVSHSPASAPRPGWYRCMSGCRKRTRPRRLRSLR